MIKINLMESYKSQYNLNISKMDYNLKIVGGFAMVPIGVVSASLTGAIGLVAFTEKMTFLPWVGLLGAYGCYLFAKVGADIATEEIQAQRTEMQLRKAIYRFNVRRGTIDDYL